MYACVYARTYVCISPSEWPGEVCMQLRTYLCISPSEWPGEVSLVWC